TLLVLDDLQWAGVDALDLLAALVRAAAAAERPLRVVGAYRDTEVRPADPLGHLLADLAREGLGTARALGPLAPRAAQELCAGLLEGATVPVAARAVLTARLLRWTGGVPFYVVSCAHAWLAGEAADRDTAGQTHETHKTQDAKGTQQTPNAAHSALGAGEEDRAGAAVPWTVAQHIRQRLGVLPAGAQELLGVAAVIGRQIPSRLLVTVTGTFGWSEREVLAGLEAACQTRLLLDAGAEGYHFP